MCTYPLKLVIYAPIYDMYFLTFVQTLNVVKFLSHTHVKNAFLCL